MEGGVVIDRKLFAFYSLLILAGCTTTGYHEAQELNEFGEYVKFQEIGMTEYPGWRVNRTLKINDAPRYLLNDVCLRQKEVVDCDKVALSSPNTEVLSLDFSSKTITLRAKPPEKTSELARERGHHNNPNLTFHPCYLGGLGSNEHREENSYNICASQLTIDQTHGFDQAIGSLNYLAGTKMRYLGVDVREIANIIVESKVIESVAASLRQDIISNFRDYDYQDVKVIRNHAIEDNFLQFSDADLEVIVAHFESESARLEQKRIAEGRRAERRRRSELERMQVAGTEVCRKVDGRDGYQAPATFLIKANVEVFMDGRIQLRIASIHSRPVSGDRWYTEERFDLAGQVISTGVVIWQDTANWSISACDMSA